MNKRIKVLIAKPGLDGHDRGAKVVAKYLRDSGMEVIYTGLRQTPKTIVNTAIQEDVDIIGLSILSGAHIQLCEKILTHFNEKKIKHPPIFVGGIIPEQDFSPLRKLGISAIFPPGTSLKDIKDEIIDILSNQ